jgi:hypothetical protein
MFQITEILNKRGTDLIGKALSSSKPFLVQLTLLLALVLCSKTASAKPHSPKKMPNLAQLVQLGQSAGLPLAQAKLMAAIGAAESGGNPIAHNQNRATGDNSYGIWQINMIDNLGPARRKEFGLKVNEQLLDPVTNAQAMKRVLQSSGPTAWTTYSSGKYKEFLPAVEKAVAGGVPTGSIPRADFDTSQAPSPQDFASQYARNVMAQSLAAFSPEALTQQTQQALNQQKPADYLGVGETAEDKFYGIRPLIMAG